MLDARDGGLLATLPRDDDPAPDPVADPSWAGDRRIVFLAGAQADPGFQVYACDLDSGRLTRLTNAPYLAFQPSAADGRTLRFLNREGWAWTVDEVPLPPTAPPPVVHIESGQSAEPAAPAPPAAEPPPPPPPTAAAVAINVIPSSASNTPASPIDQLFIPHLYGPTIAAAGRAGSFFGLVLAGNDRLERHRWAIAGYSQFVASGHSADPSLTRIASSRR